MVALLRHKRHGGHYHICNFAAKLRPRRYGSAQTSTAPLCGVDRRKGFGYKTEKRVHTCSPLPTTQQSVSSFVLVIFVAVEMLLVLVLCITTVSLCENPINQSNRHYIHVLVQYTAYVL